MRPEWPVYALLEGVVAIGLGLEHTESSLMGGGGRRVERPLKLAHNGDFQ